MRIALHSLLFIFFSYSALGQSAERKKLQAVRISEAPNVDGLLDDAVWATAPVATDFITESPTPLLDASQRTEVKVLYDDEAFYVGAFMFDTAGPDSILHQLSQRDGRGNTDEFGLALSCFQDGINGFVFDVTPDGVQLDQRLSSSGDDRSWNAVWQCNTTILENGWVAEFKIPFSAIRFPETAEQTWDINFRRNIRRTREVSWWNAINPAVDGFFLQAGILEGIKDIKPPVRLFFYPNASYYHQFEKTADGALVNGSSYNLGMDLKYGLNDAFTLDMTLIPDFGQVQNDQVVLNLGPFEQAFDENRPFFTEGTELFNKGRMFYSRRIGGSPINGSAAEDALAEGDSIIVNPGTTQLINSFKISGRNKNGTGIGFLNAISARENAVIGLSEGGTREVEVSPLTNYSVLVIDQNLKNNSFATLVNTNVMRDGATYDANATAGLFRLRNKANNIQFSGDGKFTSKFNYTGEDKNGYATSAEIEKIGGNFTYGSWFGIESDTYDPNDLGLLFNNNSIESGINGSYNIYTPFGPKGKIWFNRLWSNFGANVSYLYNPREFSGIGMNGNVGFALKNFTAFNIFSNWSPVGWRDFFEPREEGYFLLYPENRNIGAWMSTDYRKRFAFDLSGNFNNIKEDNRYNWNFSFEPRFRVSDKFFIKHEYQFGARNRQQGWVNKEIPVNEGLIDEAPAIFEDHVLIGTRDRIIHTNSLSFDYIFTNRMGITGRIRHYWSYVQYEDFEALDQQGNLTQFEGEDVYFRDNFSSYADNSFNAFTVDVVYTWVFRPGSQLSLVWKNNITKNEEAIPADFNDNFSRTLRSPQVNSLSIRVLYFLDYLNFTQKGQRIQN